MKKWLIVFLLLLVMPSNVLGVSNRTTESDNNEVTIYLFHSASCSHCKAEIAWLKSFQKEFPEASIEMYEIHENPALNAKVRRKLKMKEDYIPLTVIGNQYFIGYDANIKEQIKKQYQEALEDENYVDVVAIAKTEPDLKNWSFVWVPILGVLLGLLVGANPFSLWVFTLLFNTLHSRKDNKDTSRLSYVFFSLSGLIMFGITMLLFALSKLFAAPTVFILIGVIGVSCGILCVVMNYLPNKNKKAMRGMMIKRIDKLVNKKNSSVAWKNIFTFSGMATILGMISSYGIPLFYTQMIGMNDYAIGISLLFLCVFAISFLIPQMFCYGKLRKGKKLELPKRYGKVFPILEGFVLVFLGVMIILQPIWLIFPY